MADYKENLALQRFKIVDKFGGENKKELMQSLTVLLRIQKNQYKKQIGKLIDGL